MHRLLLLAAAALTLLPRALPAQTQPAPSQPAQTSSPQSSHPTAASAATALDADIDPAIARVIATTQSIDNHAHPVLPQEPADRSFDALPVDNMAPETDPVAWRSDYPALHDAWQALFGLDLTPPLSPPAQTQLDQARAAAHTRFGAAYAAHTLDLAGISTMVSNRVSMGPGLAPPRFLWVPYDDALLFPLDNAALAAANPDRALFFPLEDKLRARYLAAHGLSDPPPTLNAYLNFVLLTLHDQKRGGAIAVKFELAYLRDLDIGNPTQAQAEAVYHRYIHGGTPPAAEYKVLQDFLFRTIARECGRAGLAVHFHGMAGGGSYFSIAGVNPLRMEPVFNDPTLRGTKFVILHGGYPFVRETGTLLQKPNVYTDLSQQALLLPARSLATWLREWLELYPDKVLFATDGYPFSPVMGWEEATWLAARNERQALGLALTGMLRDGEITPARAAEIARMVLRDNARALYNLPPEP